MYLSVLLVQIEIQLRNLEKKKKNKKTDRKNIITYIHTTLKTAELV